MLDIVNLHASINLPQSQDKILKGIDLHVPHGQIHVIMGPNGVGKSTLGHVLMGHKGYNVTAGDIFLNQENIKNFTTAERAQKGLFLAFQYPVSIPGLKISEFLRNLYAQAHGVQIGVAPFRKILKKNLELLQLDMGTTTRYLNEGFSGGEMKRLEMLQLALVQPKVAILDEIDSGVDVDGQTILAHSIKALQREHQTSFVLVTHYKRLIEQLQPDKIHILMDGRISQSGGLDLVEQLNRGGFANLPVTPPSSHFAVSP